MECGRMTEQWKTVIYDGEVYEDYEVSTKGRVRSLGNDKTRKTRILKQHKAPNGYLHTSLRKNGKSKQVTVHRVVAETWIPNDNPKVKTVVNHLDHNRQNNSVENLEWTTQKKNVEDGRGKRVLCVETGEIFDSITQASEFLGVSLMAISKACNGKSKTCKKLHWKFVE